jgi:hypothetical protein
MVLQPQRASKMQRGTILSDWAFVPVCSVFLCSLKPSGVVPSLLVLCGDGIVMILRHVRHRWQDTNAANYARCAK